MLITELELRTIIREELTRNERDQINEQSPLLAMTAQQYLSEPSAQGLSATQKVKYVTARTTLGATPIGARTFALGKSNHGGSTFSFNGGVVPSIHAATAQQMSSLLAPVTDSTIYTVASIFDPIAILSWPAFYNAWAKYSNDKSTVNSLLLMIAALGCIPLLGSTVKGTKFAIAALKSQKALNAINKSSSVVQKTKAIAQCFGSAAAGWTSLVSELSPYADDIAREISRHSTSGVKINGANLIQELSQAATIVDKYNSHFKYINYVASNAAQSVQEFLIGRFGPKVSKSIDMSIASAAAAVETSSGIKLPTVASAPVTITQRQVTSQTNQA